MRHIIAGLIAIPALLTAQMPLAHPVSHPDYAKADLIRTSGAFVLNATVNPVWLQDSTRFYYRSASPRGEQVVFLVDPVKRTKAPLFDNVHLAQVMSLAGDTAFDQSKIPNFRLSEDERAMKFAVGKRQFECTIATYACTVTDTAKIVHPDTPNWAVLSPDKKWESFSHNYNIYVRHARIHDVKPPLDTTKGAKRPARVDSLTLPDSSIQLTTDGIDMYAYGTETPSTLPPDRPTRRRPQLIWSPDSKKIAVIRADERGVRRYPLYSSTKPQPRLVSYPYAAPGDSILIRYETYVLDVGAKSSTKMQDEKPPTIVHGMSGLDAVKWGKKSD